MVHTRLHVSCAAGIDANGAGKRRHPRRARVRELGAVCCRLRSGNCMWPSVCRVSSDSDGEGEDEEVA